MADASSSSTSTPQSSTTTCALRVGLDRIEDIGARLRQGQLVSFPTETVYGLGANALDEDACRRIFAAKERPLNDPLIVHVTSTQTAQDLWAADKDSKEGQLLQLMGQTFWPGPLTVVAKAGPRVPLVVMAGTGFVACRNPSHAIARAVIDAAQCPIVAPSANKFGHVSPTTADHVWDDLHKEDVWIVEDKASTNTDYESIAQQLTPSCHVGVESSVVKLEMRDGDHAQFTMLRQGAISVDQIEKALQEHGYSNIPVLSKFKQVAKDTETAVSPGQAIRHYSPNVPSFMVSQDCLAKQVSQLSEAELTILKQAVIIDYGQKMGGWKDKAMAYRDLSAQGDSAEAAQQIFDVLRWAELVEGAVTILFPFLDPNLSDALALAVKDRLTRAASGNVIDSLDQSTIVK